jgi:hypothetical protein
VGLDTADIGGDGTRARLGCRASSKRVEDSLHSLGLTSHPVHTVEVDVGRVLQVAAQDGERVVDWAALQAWPATHAKDFGKLAD